MINWSKITPDETRKIYDISKRALSYTILKVNPLEMQMDISAAHIHCKLDLDKFLALEHSDFIHDVCGIRSNMDRETGKLENCFVPRCAA